MPGLTIGYVLPTCAPMNWFDENWWEFHLWATIAAVAAILAVVSILADRRRHKRKSIDDVGFMPWTGISVAAMMVALLSIALAIKAG